MFGKASTGVTRDYPSIRLVFVGFSHFATHFAFLVKTLFISCFDSLTDMYCQIFGDDKPFLCWCLCTIPLYKFGTIVLFCFIWFSIFLKGYCWLCVFNILMTEETAEEEVTEHVNTDLVDI